MKTKLLLFALLGIAITTLFTACDSSELKRLLLSQYQLELNVNQSVQLEVIPDPIEAAATNKVRWKSSDNSVATVTDQGVVTGVYTGSCVITAYCGTIQAKCSVTVSSMNYEVNFTSAVAYMYDNDDLMGSNHLILRLLQPDMSVNADGDIQGNGFFLNLDLNLPITDSPLPDGLYTASSVPALYTFLQGALVEQESVAYASGSFLGYYSNAGLTPIFCQAGTIQVDHTDSIFTIQGALVGPKQESMQTYFSGPIHFVDLSTSGEVQKVEFQIDTVHYIALGVNADTTLNIMRLQFFNPAGNMLRLDCYVPLSYTDSIPMGLYTLDDAQQLPFRLIPASPHDFAGCWLNDATGMTPLTRGTLRLSRNALNGVDYTFSFYDNDGRYIYSTLPLCTRFRIAP